MQCVIKLSTRTRIVLEEIGGLSYIRLSNKITQYPRPLTKKKINKLQEKHFQFSRHVLYTIIILPKTKIIRERLRQKHAHPTKYRFDDVFLFFI